MKMSDFRLKWRSAAKANDLVSVQELSRSFGVRSSFHDGETLLHEASGMGAFDVCELLLKMGASPNVEGWDGVTPMHRAAVHGEKLYNLLLSFGGEENKQRSISVWRGGTPKEILLFSKSNKSPKKNELLTKEGGRWADDEVCDDLE